MGEVLPPIQEAAAELGQAALTSQILDDITDQGKGAWGEGVGVQDENAVMTNQNVMCCSDATFCSVCNAGRDEKKM